MNRKNAFTAIVPLPRKMDANRGFNNINVMPVANNFQAETGSKRASYGKNTQKANKPICNWPISTLVPLVPSVAN